MNSSHNQNQQMTQQTIVDQNHIINQHLSVGRLKLTSYNCNGSIGLRSRRDNDVAEVFDLIMTSHITLLQDVRTDEAGKEEMRNRICPKDSFSLWELRKSNKKGYPGAGGVGVVVRGHYRSFLTKRIFKDERKLGRYVGIIIKTTPIPLAIFSIYLPSCGGETDDERHRDGNRQYQWEYIRRNNLDTEPRLLLLNDLIKICKELYEDGIRVILGGDFNTNLKTYHNASRGEMERWNELGRLGLVPLDQILGTPQPITLPTRGTSPDAILTSGDGFLSPTDYGTIQMTNPLDHSPLFSIFSGEITLPSKTDHSFTTNAIPSLHDKRKIEEYQGLIGKAYDEANLEGGGVGRESKWILSFSTIVSKTVKAITPPPISKRRKGGHFPGYEWLSKLARLYQSWFDSSFPKIRKVCEKLRRWWHNPMRKLDEEVRDMVRNTAMTLDILHMIDPNITFQEWDHFKNRNIDLPKRLMNRLHGKRRMQNRINVSEHSERIEKWREQGKLGRVIKSALELSSPNRLNDVGTIDGEIVIGEDSIALHLRNIFEEAFTSNKTKSTKPRRCPEVTEAINILKDENDEYKEKDVFDKITPLKIRRYILGKRKNTAPGPDGVTINSICALPVGILDDLVETLHSIIVNLKYVSCWDEVFMITIPKDPSGLDLRRQRPISLLLILRKLTLGVVANVLSELVSLEDEQYGFRKGRTTEDAVSKLITSIAKAKSKKEKWFGLSLDLKAAFDSIPLCFIQVAGESLGIPSSIMKWFIKYQKTAKVEISIKQNKGTGHIFTPTQGVPQGSVEGPIIFIWVLNILLTMLRLDSEKRGVESTLNGLNLKYSAFADDIILTSNSLQDLTKMFLVVQKFLKATGMILSAKKSIFSFNEKGRSKTNARNINLGLINEMTWIDSSSSFRYLGHQINPEGNTIFEWNSALDIGIKSLAILRRKNISTQAKIEVIRSRIMSQIMFKVRLFPHKDEHKFLNKLDIHVRRVIRNASIVNSYPNALLHSPFGKAWIPSFFWELTAQRVQTIIKSYRTDRLLVEQMYKFDFYFARRYTNAVDLFEVELMEKGVEVGEGIKPTETDSLIVYTDGSLIASDFPEDRDQCWGSKKRRIVKAGAGVVIADSHGEPLQALYAELDPSGVSSSFNTEVAALAIGMRDIVERDGVKRVLFYTDSESSLKCLERMEETYKKAQKGRSASNSIWMDIYDLFTKLKNRNVSISFYHVYSHPEKKKKYEDFTINEKGNYLADKVAGGENPFDGAIEVVETMDPLESSNSPRFVRGEEKEWVEGDIKSLVLDYLSNSCFTEYVTHRGGTWPGASYAKTGNVWGRGLHVRLLFDWTPHYKNLNKWKLRDRDQVLYDQVCGCCKQGTEDDIHWILSCESTEFVRRNVLLSLEEKLTKIAPNVYNQLFRVRNRETALLVGGLITTDKWDKIKNLDEEVKKRICRVIVKEGAERLRKIWKARNSVLYEHK